MKVRVRRRTAAILTLALVSAGVGVAVVSTSGKSPQGHETVATGPIEGQVHTIKLRATSATAASAPAQSTPPFSLLGVAWDRPGVHLKGTVNVRTRSVATGAWSAWRPVTVNVDDVPDGTRERSRQGATAPLWTGPSNGVDIRVAGRRTLPAGLHAVLVDPGTKRRRAVRAHAEGRRSVRVALAADTTAPADPSTAPTQDSPSPTPTDTPSAPESSAPAPTASTSDSATPSASPSPTQTTSTAPRPTIVPRVAWGADETQVKSPPSYGDVVKVVFVHHTDTGNDYSCADSASVVRGIFDYHVNTNGWDDIGYNFLVDKCGTLFEGRAGGVDRPVIGAQAYGFNTNSAGVAVLGTFTDAAPTQATLDTIARVAAWKLGLSGADPTGSSTLIEGVKDGNFTYGSEVTFKRISGHRDANTTACPGQLLYDKLPDIRTAAGQLTAPDTVKPVFTSPASLSLRTGTASTTNVPVSLKWKATDDRQLRTVKLTRTATSVSVTTFSPSTTSWSTYAKPSISTIWSLSAVDAAGNTATSSVTRTTSVRSDSSSTRTGTWKTTTNSHYLGGKGLYSSVKGATASWTVTGRSVALIDKRATTSGKFYVYVDGAYAATIDTRASSSLYRQIQWTRTWSSSARHTIKLKVAGTSGRPTVAIDGLAYIG